MNEILLRDKDTEPTVEVLKSALGNEVYDIYGEFTGNVESIGIKLQWRYYNDGKAWLCKAVWKKKTVFWLSVWDGLFKTTVYFTEKTRTGIEDLSVSRSIKERILSAEPTGKLVPLTFDISNSDQIADLYTIIEYKKALK